MAEDVVREATFWCYAKDRSEDKAKHDKTYVLKVVRREDDTFDVIAQYGRRCASLQTKVYASGVGQFTALDVFATVRLTRLQHGYIENPTLKDYLTQFAKGKV